MVQFRFAFNEDLTHEGLESLCQCGVGDVALVLVELARGEKSTRRHKRLVQFVHHGGFTDAGVTGYEHDFWCTARHDPVEGRQQGFDLGLPPIEVSRYEQPV